MRISGPRHLVSQGDALQTVTTNVRTALELFTTSGNINLHDDVDTTTQPPRSTKTSTVTTQSGLMTRAITLTTLATENHAFFEQRAFYPPEELERSATAIRELQEFLRKNSANLTATVVRNRAFLAGELKRTQQELPALEAALRQEKDPEQKATLEGRINITNLRILRLQELSKENDTISRFFQQFQPPTPRGSQLPARKRDGRK